MNLWTITPDQWQKPEGGWVVPKTGHVRPKSAATLKREEKQLRPFRTRARASSLYKSFP